MNLKNEGVMKRRERNLSVYSIITAVALSAYFIIMDLLGYSHITELRLINGAILGAGIFLAVRHVSKNEDSNYLNGLRVGFKTGVGAVGLFTLVFLVYVGMINPEFITTINQSHVLPMDVNVFLMLSVIILEGVASTAIMAFMAMQYFKSKSFHNNVATID